MWMSVDDATPDVQVPALDAIAIFAKKNQRS